MKTPLLRLTLTAIVLCSTLLPPAASDVNRDAAPEHPQESVTQDAALGSPPPAIVANGHVQQQRDKGGFAKAMIFVRRDGAIMRGFNSYLNGVDASTLPCGFSVRLGATISSPSRHYAIDFGFQVDDRFLSVFTSKGSVQGILYGQDFDGTNPNSVLLTTSEEADLTVIVF